MIISMLCEICKKNQATIHYTEVVNGMRTEHHVCSRCAATLNLSGYGGLLENDFPFVKLLTGLLASNEGMTSSSDLTMQHIRCPQCDMSFAEFARVGKFGCAGCYDVFGPLIEENIKKKQQGFSENDINKKLEDEILNLTMKQREAVEFENYELAAKYRDEIKELKKSQNEERKHSNA